MSLFSLWLFSRIGDVTYFFAPIRIVQHLNHNVMTHTMIVSLCLAKFCVLNSENIKDIVFRVLIVAYFVIDIQFYRGKFNN